MHQLGMMDEEFRVVPFWGVRPLEADSLLSDCFIGYDSTPAKGSSRRPSTDLELSSELTFEGDQGDLSKWAFPLTVIQNEQGRVSCSSDGGSDGGMSDNDDDASWLEEFMNVYGITDLDENDYFYVKDADTAIIMAEPEQEEKNIPPVPSQPIKRIKEQMASQSSVIRSDTSMNAQDGCTTVVDVPSQKGGDRKRKAGEALAGRNDMKLETSGKRRSSGTKIPRENVYEKSSIGLLRDRGGKWTTTPTGFGGVSERKREQNRHAAIRYRDKRREEAKQKKEELHELELRNVQLKTELIWLEKETAYLKNLMKLTNST